MFARLAEASTSLDVGTLFVIATCVTTLLGLFLLFAWMQDRVQALAWWGLAYLLGGFSGTLWQLGGLVSPPLPSWIADVLLFIALGMIWSAARLFHGRQVRWGAMCFGGTVWAASNMTVGHAAFAGRADYAELGHCRHLYVFDRRRTVARTAQIADPALAGGVRSDAARRHLSVSGGAGVTRRAQPRHRLDRRFRHRSRALCGRRRLHRAGLGQRPRRQRYKAAAETDPLTSLLNRRGFFAAAAALLAGNKARKTPVSVLAFDLDHFKSINDRFGHKSGDAVLGLFARTAQTSLRADDVVGRIGGEEFVAVISGTLAEACIAAERVRSAFERAAVAPGGPQIPATVSIGVACGLPDASIDDADCPRRRRALSRQGQRA